MKQIAASALLLCLFSSHASALTGAEFIQTDKAFIVGYTFGVIDERITVIAEDDVAALRIRTCVLQSKMTAETMYYVAFRYFQQNPSALRENALVGVLNSINDMCK